MRGLLLVLFPLMLVTPSQSQVLLTLNNDTVRVDLHSPKMIYVLLSNQPCSGCILFLGEFLTTLRSNPPITIITTVPNGNLVYKKEYVKSLKRTFPKNTTFLTDTSGAVLRLFHVLQYPALLLSHRDSVEYIPYEFLFNDVFLTQPAKKRIKKYSRHSR